MNPRERILLIAVGAVLVLVAGNAIRKGYFGAIDAMENTIRQKKQKLADLRKNETQLVRDADTWREIGAQTLSMNPNEAITKLRDELYTVAEKSGLKDRVEVTVGTVTTGGMKEGSRVLGASLSGTGTVEQVRAMLFEMARQPYLLRVKELGLEPLMEPLPGNTRVREFRGQLEFRAKVETLLLPETKVVPKVTPAIVKADERKPAERTTLPTAGHYEKLARSWFEAWKPEPVVGVHDPVLSAQRDKPVIEPPKPTMAQNPNPAPGATNIPISTQLRWTPGTLATKHRVYFGTTNPPPLEGEQPGTILVKDNLEYSTTYTWRIDEISYKVPEEPPASQPSEATASAPAMAEAAETQPADGSATRPALAGGAATRPAPVKKPEPVEVVVTGQVWTFTTMPEPPPPDAELQLVSVLSSPRSQQVVLRNPTNPNAPDTRVEVGGMLYGGVLVFVHPRGAVSEKRGTRRFHPVGEVLKSGRVLTANDDPVVYDALLKLQARLAGISEQPG